LLFDLVQNPEKWSPQLEDFSARVMSRLTWGSPDPSERLKPDAWALLTTMSPAGPLNNMLTPLNWIPHSFNPWKKVEKERHTGQREWFLQLQTDVREQIRRDEAGPSFTQKYLQAGESFGFPNDVEGAYAVGMLAVAGVFTVGGPLHTFVQAMLLFPQWLKSLQEELDTVCGDRMPELADVPQLPLLRAVIKESLRWRPAVPTGKS
jgi:cytochrome P450